MLELAIKHRDLLTLKILDIAMDDEYKFAWHDSWRDQLNLKTDTWSSHQFVSINKEGEIVGYISYDIDRDNLACTGVQVINFYKNTLSRCFSNDLRQAIDDIFTRYQFRKVRFSAIVGSPAEKFYDKYINQMGGRIIGYFEKEAKLIDGEYYDIKYYEVMKDSYLKAIALDRNTSEGQS